MSRSSRPPPRVLSPRESSEVKLKNVCRKSIYRWTSARRLRQLIPIVRSSDSRVEAGVGRVSGGRRRRGRRGRRGRSFKKFLSSMRLFFPPQISSVSRGTDIFPLEIRRCYLLLGGRCWRVKVLSDPDSGAT